MHYAADVPVQVWARAYSISPDGIGALAYLSVVDNATNDASFVRGIKKVTYPAP